MKHGVVDVKDYTVGNDQRDVDNHDEDEVDEDDDEDEDDEEDGISDVGRAISGQEGVLKGASPHSYCVAAYCTWHIAHCGAHAYACCVFGIFA